LDPNGISVNEYHGQSSLLFSHSALKNRWYHYAVTFEHVSTVLGQGHKGTIKLYRNGMLDETYTDVLIGDSTGNDLMLGSLWNN